MGILTKLFNRKESAVNNRDQDPPLRTEESVKKENWIGVDLDGTLAYFDTWRGMNHIGKPIEPMMARVKDWIKDGYTVKIVTARASVEGGIEPVKKWLAKHKLPDLEVVAGKDFYMLELWDDRSVQVIHNMGKPVISPSVLSLPKAPLLETKPNKKIAERSIEQGHTPKRRETHPTTAQIEE